MTPLEPDSHDYEGQSEKLAELVNGQFFCQVININRSGECYDVDLYNDNLDTVMPGNVFFFFWGGGGRDFDFTLDHISRISQLHTAHMAHVPCDMLYAVPVLLTGC